MYAKLKFLVASFSLLTALSAQAIAPKRNVVYFGGTVGGNTLYVKDDNGKELASLYKKTKFNGTVGYERLPRPLWGSIPWLRSSFEFSVSQFEVSLQKVARVTDVKPSENQNGIDLGSSAQGYMSYLNPTLLLYFSLTETISLSFGVGFGLGYASVKGDYYQVDGDVAGSCANSTTKADIIANCEKDSFAFNKAELSNNLLAVLSMGWFGIRVDGGTITTKSGEKQFDFSRSSATLYVQYHF